MSTEPSTARRRASRPLRAGPAARGGGGRGPGRPYALGLLVAAAALLLALVAVRAPAVAVLGPEARPQFDAGRALAVARHLAKVAPDREPGSATAGPAADEVAAALRDAARLPVLRERFAATDAAGVRRTLTNLVVVEPGRSREALVVLAHRDAPGPGPGLLDNATGTGALVELARVTRGAPRTRTWVFASVDGAGAAQAGARRLAATLPGRLRPVAVVAVDAPATPTGPLPIAAAGTGGRRAPAGLVGTLAAALREARDPPVGATTPRALAQILDLVAPPAPAGAQAPFVDRGLPAVQVGDGGDRDAEGPVSRRRLAAVGLALDGALLALDAAEPPSGPVGPYVLVRGRVLPGWSLELVVAALLLGPALVAACAVTAVLRPGRPWAPAAAVVARGVLPALGAVAGVRLAAAAGLVPTRPWAHPDARAAAGVGAAALTALLVGAVLGAAVGSRIRTRVRRPRDAERVDYGVALGAAAVGALLAFAANPFSALVLVPTLHAWVTLPRLARSAPAVRLAVVWAPALLVPVAVAADRHAGPADLVRALADGRLPTGTALGVAVTLAAALVLTGSVTRPGVADAAVPRTV